MTKLRITSNPYLSKIKYEKYNGIEWAEDDNFNKAELSSNAYFPFIVSKVADRVERVYSTGDESVSIEFNGTNDEYEMLKDVCSADKYSDIIVSRGDEYLENGEYVLKKIRIAFKELSRLTREVSLDDKSISQNLSKISEASDEVVPICVIGTYSSGKSALINAFIGCDILPSSQYPTTAKLFSISSVNSEKDIRIEFNYVGTDFSVTYDGSSFSLFPAADKDKYELAGKISDLIKEKCTEEPMTVVREVLLAIDNHISSHKNEDLISDSIKISVPFSDGALKAYPGKFVIFDTPGSNAQNNTEHLETLRNSMNELSNGLIIFVSDNKLDTKDNYELTQQICQMNGFDKRFAIIAVNAADSISFADFSVEKTMESTVAQQLYSQGLFFLSSVMGLGAKKRGKFLNPGYLKPYTEHLSEFSSADPSLCTALYRYNILPGNVYDKYCKAAQSEPNVMYANSGLMALEEEVVEFALRHSSYNKCAQSKQYLDTIRAQTSELISLRKQQQEDAIAQLENDFESLKAKLTQKLMESDEECRQHIHISHSVDLKFSDEEYTQLISPFNYLKDREERRKEYWRKELDYYAVCDELSEADNSRKGKRKNGIGSFLHKPSLRGAKDILSDSEADRKYVHTLKSDKEAIEKEIDKNTADELIEYANERLREISARLPSEFFERSERLYTAASADFANKLHAVITGCEYISESDRAGLIRIVSGFPPVNIENSSAHVLDKRDFTSVLQIGPFRIGNSNNLRLERLKAECEKQAQMICDEICAEISARHGKIFDLWASGLMNALLANPIEYNNELREKSEEIKSDRIILEELMATYEQICRDYNDIEHELSWKKIKEEL